MPNTAFEMIEEYHDDDDEGDDYDDNHHEDDEDHSLQMPFGSKRNQRNQNQGHCFWLLENHN